MDNKDTRPLFHKLSQDVVDALIGQPLIVAMEKYRQPDWCDYPDALRGEWGCWSLNDSSHNGLRTKISKKYCKNCDCYNPLAVNAAPKSEK